MQEEHELFHAFLTQHGQRYTAVRRKILDVILAYQGDFTVRNLLPLIRVDNVEINRASLYRNFKLLQLAGIIEEVPASESLRTGEFRLIRRTGRRCVLFCPGCHSDEEFFDEQFDESLIRLCRRFQLNPDTMLVRIEARHLHGSHVSQTENDNMPRGMRQEDDT